MSVFERRLGEVRPTQLIYTYGIGQVVDLPQMSGLVMGLDDWPEAYCPQIEEERLLEEVRRVLGQQVEKLVRPPPQPDGPSPSPMAGQAPTIGVPVAPFPRYLRCSYCRILAPIASGLFRLRTIPGRPDLAHYEHANCTRVNSPRVLPARFLVACEAGHLDDFPWAHFIHGAGDPCDGVLQLDESGFTGEAADIRVSCRKCGKHKRMSLAFGEEAAKHLPRCAGRRPHLRDYEETACTKRAETILLGASNLWFAAHRTALHIPVSAKSQLARLVERNWVGTLSAVEDIAVLGYLRKQGKLAELATHNDQQIWAAIERRRSSNAGDDAVDIKTPEWRALTFEEQPEQTTDFELEQVAEPVDYKRQIRRVVLVKRLRAVTAIVGFSRIVSPREFVQDGELPSMRAPLSRQAPRFVPASEVRGEGLFIELEQGEVERWLDRQGVPNDQMLGAHQGYRRARKLEPDSAGYPGLKFVLLHSFSHALMRQLALECGYSAASIRERIYANDDRDRGPIMAGVLLYTSAPDSEGTLGGLVRMGEANRLNRLIRAALEDAHICSSDPLCGEHLPDDRALHGAACHACGFAPETSCEAGNRYLDRRALVATVASRDGFFER